MSALASVSNESLSKLIWDFFLWANETCSWWHHWQKHEIIEFSLYKKKQTWLQYIQIVTKKMLMLGWHYWLADFISDPYLWGIMILQLYHYAVHLTFTFAVSRFVFKSCMFLIKNEPDQHKHKRAHISLHSQTQCFVSGSIVCYICASVLQRNTTHCVPDCSIQRVYVCTNFH